MFNKLIFQFFLILHNLFSQELTGKDLLEKTINFHDQRIIGLIFRFFYSKNDYCG